MLKTQKLQFVRLKKLSLLLVLTFTWLSPDSFFILPAISASHQSVADRQYRAGLLLRLGNRQLTTGQFAAALATLQESMQIYLEIGDRAGEANSLFQLGETYFSLGNYQRAITLYQRSLRIMQDLGNQPSQAQILEHLSNSYIQVGNQQLAEEFKTRAVELRREIGNPEQAATFFSNVGLEHKTAGEYQQAIAFHTKQLEMAKKTNNRPQQVYAFQNLAITHRKLNQFPQAIDFYQQGLTIANQLDDAALSSIILNQLAETYVLQGDFPQAIAFYQQQLQLAEKPNSPINKAELIKQLGRAYTALGDQEKALSLYNQQLQLATNKFTEGTALNNLAFVNLKSGNLTEAEENLNKSLKLWQSLRSDLTNTENFAPEQSHTYRLLQQVLIAQKKPEAALEVAEEGSMMAFLNLLGMRLDSEAAGTNLKVAPKQVQPPTIKDIQAIAQQRQATLVKYAIFPDNQLYVWVIQPTGKIIFRQIDPKSENTISPINSIAEVIANIPGSLGLASQKTATKTDAKPLLQLNQLLIKPIADLLPSNPQEQVIFIPQDELWFIPFAALVDIFGEHLIEKHTISTIPAIHTLQLTREVRNRTGGRNVVVVGNPIMPRVARSINQTPQPLPPLVNAEQEALKVADFFKTTALIGNQATKAEIVSLLPDAKTIHLATYGILDDINRQGIPGAIALASAGNANGLLTASEILNLYTQPQGKRLRANLAFLSAGETGIGSRGNGVIGLSLALIHAGVPSVIISQWAAADTPTSVFTTEFYRQLKQNSNKAQALRNTMLTMMKEYPNPRDWAGFSLMGEVR
jgi:CHAT domain-containing protein